MSEKELNTQLISKQLRKVYLKGENPTVILSDDIINKIKYLCKNIAKVEWSGILFYEVSAGSIVNSSNLKLVVKDILLMDKGTHGYTSYELDEDVISYMIDNQIDIKTIKMGHIHSHNTMGVFFSGTDTDELNDNSGFHNYYLSIIVNNYLDILAKVAFRAKVEPIPIAYIAHDENGGMYYPTIAEYVASDEIVVIRDCDVEANTDVISVSDDFDSRMKTIIEQSEIREKQQEAEKRRLEALKKPQQLATNNIPGARSWKRELDADGWWKEGWDGKTTLESLEENIEEVEEIETEDVDDVDFLCFVLRFGKVEAEDELEFALADLKAENIKSKIIASTIRDSIIEWYNKFYGIVANQDMSSFLETLDEILTILEEWRKDYIFVPAIIKELTAMSEELTIKLPQ